MLLAERPVEYLQGGRRRARRRAAPCLNQAISYALLHIGRNGRVCCYTRWDFIECFPRYMEVSARASNSVPFSAPSHSTTPMDGSTVMLREPILHSPIAERRIRSTRDCASLRPQGT